MPGKKLSIKNKIERGYGEIVLEEPWNYQPWIQAKELYHGKGRRHMIPDLKYPQRMIHLMSDLELEVYYMLRKDKKVLELYEQFPLSLVQTEKLCDELNIVHPKDPKTKENIIMTTDFLAVICDGEGFNCRAYAVKTVEDMKNQRVLEKLKIEQKFWESLQIPWCVITEQTIK